MKWILNNIQDTLNLLDNSIFINNELKSKFYQIITIKKIYEKIIYKSKNINGFINEIKLSSEQLLKIPEIKEILLQFKLLTIMLRKNNIYDNTINNLLFNPICEELCSKLKDLLDNKTKDEFIQLILFIFKKKECFKILELLYPFDNENIYKRVKN